MPLFLGSDRLLASHHLDGRRVGIVCNPASVDGELRHIADRLAARSETRLTAIFGPQHGFRSDVQDNMVETRHAHDEARPKPEGGFGGGGGGFGGNRGGGGGGGGRREPRW